MQRLNILVKVASGDYQIICYKRKGRETVYITSNGDEIRKALVSQFGASCQNCEQTFWRKSITPAMKRAMYTCQSCNKQGDKNHAYGKSWKQMMRDAHGDNADNILAGVSAHRSTCTKGAKNPMFNRSIQDVWKEKLTGEEYNARVLSYSKSMHSATLGERNGFFGKKHTAKTKQRLSDASQRYFDVSGSVRYADISKSILREALDYYAQVSVNQADVASKFGHDFRTIAQHAVDVGLFTQSELNILCQNSQRLSFISSPERKLGDMLDEKYSVDRQVKIGKFVHDLVINNKLIVEYDGYYFHQILRNEEYEQNKNQSAIEHGYEIYHVEENIQRKIDWQRELSIIGEKLDGL